MIDNDGTFNSVGAHYPNEGGPVFLAPIEAQLTYETTIDIDASDRLEKIHRHIFSARGAFGLTRFYQTCVTEEYRFDDLAIQETKIGTALLSLGEVLRTDYRTIWGRFRAAVMDIRRWLRPRVYYWLRRRRFTSKVHRASP